MSQYSEIKKYYNPQPVQRRFHESMARYPLLEGGRGGGKSTALVVRQNTGRLWNRDAAL